MNAILHRCDGVGIDALVIRALLEDLKPGAEKPEGRKSRSHEEASGEAEWSWEPGMDGQCTVEM